MDCEIDKRIETNIDTNVNKNLDANSNTNEELNEGDKDKWGYAVCFGTVISFIAGIGHVNSFGLIYKDFINDTQSTAKSLTSAHGVFAVMLAVGGIILNITSKRYSLRLGGIVGAIIMLTGSFATIFITSTNQLPITFGALQGIGFGMMVPVCYSTINYYYVRKRTMVMSVCKAFQGIILMWYPQFLKNMLHIYGFRGTLLIISGIALHAVPGMLVMKIKEEPRGKLRTANNIKGRNEDHESVDLMNSKPHDQVININGLKNKKGLKKICMEILDTFNVKIVNDPVYCNICIGQSFVNFSDLTFFVFQPMLLFQYGYDSTHVAACISICAGADLAGRCALAFISSVVNINTRTLFYVSTFFTFLFRLVVLQLREFSYVAAVTAVLGVLRAWLHVTSPLVISNHVTHADFPGAYALFMLSAGLVNVTFAPIIGLLKDVYQDYLPAFYALTVCCLPCLVLWPIEYLLKRS